MVGPLGLFDTFPGLLGKRKMAMRSAIWLVLSNEVIQNMVTINN